MHILIIGKNGQVGSALALTAKKNHVNFTAVGREELDISDAKAVTVFFDKHAGFDFIINTAAYTQVDAAEENYELSNANNNRAVSYLAAASKKYSIPLIHLSTDYIFDGKKQTDYNEADLPNPQNVYGQTKLAGENALKEITHQYIILRVSWIFSEFGKNFVKTIAELANKKTQFKVVCDQIGSPTSAYSIAETILTICTHLFKNSNDEHLWGTYHYSDFPATSWHQLASYIVSLKENTNSPIEVCAITSDDYPTAAKRPKNSVLNNYKIKKTFGIRQNNWMDEVKRIVESI